jgi:lysyl-tRNA synthetase class 2
MLRDFSIVPESVIGAAQRPLFFLLAGFILTFGVARLSTRLARAGVFSNLRPGSIITAGGLHIHHSVFGIIGMIASGILAFALTPPSPWIELLAFAFGSAAALTLDEFALILHLEDVYWTGEGRASIDAVILGVTFITLLLTGLLPRSIRALQDYVTLSPWTAIALVVGGTTFVVVSYLKGKLFVGTIGIFVPLVAAIGALRLAKPNSPWAHRQYVNNPAKLERARRRDEGFHQRWQQRKHYVWDLIGGKPHLHILLLHAPREQIDARHDDPSAPGERDDGPHRKPQA